ncbi:MAG: hypothetical protein ACTSXQ_08045 [Alphaproteobacteria bacterium]
MMKKIMLYTAMIALLVFTFSRESTALEITKDFTVTIKGQSFILPIPKGMCHSSENGTSQQSRTNKEDTIFPDTTIDMIALCGNKMSFPFTAISIYAHEKDLLSPSRYKSNVLIDQKYAENIRGRKITFMGDTINRHFVNIKKTDDMLIYIAPESLEKMDKNTTEEGNAVFASLVVNHVPLTFSIGQNRKTNFKKLINEVEEYLRLFAAKNAR